MELGATDAEEAIQLPRAEIPLELQKNFTGLRNVALFYAAYCRKLNHKSKVQNRVLIATLDHLYCCHPNGDILRCVTFGMIEKIYHDPERKQVGIVIPREYDLLVALLDTFHFVHVIHSLRSLHDTEKPLVVEQVKRSKQRKSAKKSQSGSQQQPASSSGHLAQDEDNGGSKKAENKPKSAAGKRADVTHNLTFFDKIAAKFFNKPPPGVIPGWNDAFLDAEDDGSGENVVGSESEVCLGKGYYALRLEKPEGFALNLYNVSSEGI